LPPTNLDLDALWTVAEAAKHAKVSEATIRSWAHRGHLPVARNHDDQEIRDPQGRPRFWPLDVAKAEAKTREHARRPPPRVFAAQRVA
jgi:predicted site-specific integrase-resolvase